MTSVPTAAAELAAKRAPQVAAAPAVVAGATTVSLTPRAAAEAWLGRTATVCGEPVREQRCAGTEAVPGLGIDARAGSAALASVREVPLRRRADGSYEYESDAFKAVIEPDGSVDFEDRLGEVSIGPLVGYDSDRDDARFGLNLTVNFDFDDFVEKVLLERSLYPAAKARFIEQTQALRSQLAAEYNRRGAVRAHITLHRALMRVLRDDALAPRDKRSAIFTLWDDCAEDDQGTEAQHAIERFVREHMPRGSALGYPDEELVALNAQRAGRRPFAPYATDRRGATDAGT
jgi:hypothetical protein